MEDIYWQYRGLIGFMEQYPATYGLESQRAALHKKLEGYFPGKEEELKLVLHNLPDNFMFDDLCFAVANIEGFKKDSPWR